MQYIPIAAVPMTNTRSPQTRYYTEGEKEGSMTEHQVVRRAEDFDFLQHTNKQLTKSKYLES